MPNAHGTVGYTSDKPPTTQMWQNFWYLGSLLFRYPAVLTTLPVPNKSQYRRTHLTPSCHLLPIRRQRPHPHASGTKLEKTTRPQFAEAAFRGREKCTEGPTFHPRKAEHSGAHSAGNKPVYFGSQKVGKRTSATHQSGKSLLGAAGDGRASLVSDGVPLHAYETHSRPRQSCEATPET